MTFDSFPTQRGAESNEFTPTDVSNAVEEIALRHGKDPQKVKGYERSNIQTHSWPRALVCAALEKLGTTVLRERDMTLFVRELSVYEALPSPDSMIRGSSKYGSPAKYASHLIAQWPPSMLAERDDLLTLARSVAKVVQIPTPSK